MSQLTYNLVPGVGVEGMIAMEIEGTIIVPRLAQGLVPVGKLCTYGTDAMTGPPLATVSSNSTNPGQIKSMPSGVGSDPLLRSQYLGVPIYDATRAPYDVTLGYSCYSDKETVPTLLRGGVYTTPESVASVSPGGIVYVRITASGANTILGRFSAIAGTGLVAITGARWYSGPMQGSLAIAYFDF